MKSLLWAFLILSILSLFSPVSQAAPSCTEWMKQDNGSYQRVCVDDDGKQYCEQSYRGHITRISCF